MEGPRACKKSEFDEVISLINNTFRDGIDQDIQTDYPLVFNHSNLKYMRIVKADGKLVSQIPLMPREVIASADKFIMGDISPTITHPDYRKRGYATLCLRDCIKIMEQQNWPISVLWTQEQTFPFYQHCDFEAVASQGWVYKLNANDYDNFDAGKFEVIQYNPATADHLEAIIKIHDAEPYRIARTHAQYQALFSLPKITTTLAVKAGKITAYLMFGQGVNKPGVIEAGGSDKGVEALVRAILSKQNSDHQIEFQTPFTPTTLGKLLETKKPASQYPIEKAEGHGYQMMRINSLDKLMRQIKNFLQNKSIDMAGQLCIVCKESSETVTLKFNYGSVEISNEPLTEKITLTRRQLTKLVFGNHPKAKPITCPGQAGTILKKIFPLYFPIWQLDHS